MRLSAIIFRGFRKRCFIVYNFFYFYIVLILVHFFVDVDDVKYVINFDFPSSSEDYIHRIGRTGRKTQMGTAYAFFTIQNMRHAKDLIEVLREAGQTVNPRLSELAEIAKTSHFAKGFFQ